MIVAFHRPDSLARLLCEVAHRELEIVVVNVENDADVARVASECTVLPLDHNVGYAAAVNIAVRHAASSVIVFMNDDLTVTGDSVLRLVDAVETGADVAVPRVEDRNGRTVRTVAAVPTPASLAREWLLLPDEPVYGLRRLGIEKWRDPLVPERIRAASALLVATRRDLLVDRPLPEDYFLYWEESEWFWRLEQDGARVELRPESVCVHDGGRDDVRPDKSRLLARNAVRCVRRTQGRRAAGLAYLVVIAWNLRLASVDSLRWVLRDDRPTRDRVRARWTGVAAAVGAAREIL